LVLRYHARAQGARPNSGQPGFTGGDGSKLARDETIKLALHKLDAHTFRDEVMAGESVPFLGYAQREVKVLDRRKVQAQAFIRVIVDAVCFGLSKNRRRREHTGDVEQARKFLRFKSIDDRERRVVIVPKRKDAGYG
jgi:hypothetical protein